MELTSISVAEAAALAGLGVKQIRNLLRKGKIRGVLDGHVWRVERESAATYARSTSGRPLGSGFDRARALEMLHARQGGASLASLGRCYGISRQRVLQILQYLGKESR